jgi:hypothetical protein
MHQMLMKAERSPRTAAGALAAAALLAVAIGPAGARAGNLTVPHAANTAPTVPQAAGSGTPAPAPTPPPTPSPAASGNSGQSSPGGSGSSGSDPFWGPGDYGIPNFTFPRPDLPQPGSRGCDSGCDEQWNNYYMAAATAAQHWAEDSTGAEAAQAAALADSLWTSAEDADEHLNGAMNGPASGSTDASAAPALDQAGQQDDEALLPDAVPFGWALGSSDWTEGPVADTLTLLLEDIPDLLGANNTTTCPKEEIDGKVPICPD